MQNCIPSKFSRKFAVAATVFVLVCVVPVTQGVVPAPDGGYPGGNTAEGQNALLSLTAGMYNTAVGIVSLGSNTEGSYNTAIGAAALLLNTADYNTATGFGALLSNDIGGGNVANGAFALLSNTTGSNNTAIGYNALDHNTTGESNTANGSAALFSNTAGTNNVAIGVSALQNNGTGAGNTALGYQALFHNTGGSANTAVGNAALQVNTGGENTAVGNAALQDNTTANNNTAVGNFALSANAGPTATANTAVGDLALGFNGTGAGNTAVGASALCCADAGNNNTLIGSGVMSMVLGSIGNNNTAVGADALRNATGANNVALGHDAGRDLGSGDNNIDIGNEVVGLTEEHDTIRIGNSNITTTIVRGISGATISSGATVLVASNGQLGTMTSSERFKQNIKPMDKASEALLALKPVTFYYKKQIDPEAKTQFGLIAEEVEKVNPDLVVRDERGKPYSVRYDQVNAMLLNEFLKEHSKVERLEASATDQQKEIDFLRSEVKQQRALLQKVNDKLKIKQPRREIAATDE